MNIKVGDTCDLEMESEHYDYTKKEFENGRTCVLTINGFTFEMIEALEPPRIRLKCTAAIQ